MPPKSAKKELKTLWHSCDKCEVKVIQSKLKSHETVCGTSENVCEGVFNEKFITSSMNHCLPSEFELKDAPKLYMQRYIFIPETICTLCNFQMGSNVLIELNDKKYIRSSWTISDKHQDTIFSTSDGN